MGMAYERKTVSLVRLSEQMQEERNEKAALDALERAADPGQRELDAVGNLRRLLQHRFGSVTAGWREAVDIRGLHYIGEADWFKVMRSLGFGFGAKQAWDELSRSKKQVTLADLDPEAAVKLSSFYNSFREEIGPLHELLSGSSTLRIGQAAFRERCAVLGKATETRDKADLQAVFTSLQTINNYITAADLAWLEQYCRRGDKSSPSKPPESDGLPTRADFLEKAARKRAVAEFRRQLQHRFGGVVQGWRAVLDRNGAGRVTSEEFEAVVEALECGEGTGVWDELVGADAEFMKLEDLCPEGPAAVKEFKDRCVQCFGSLNVAFEEMLAKDKPFVEKDELAKFCMEIKLHANHNLLFDYLDQRGTGQVLLSNIDQKAAEYVCGAKAVKKAIESYGAMEAKARKSPRITMMERVKEVCSEHKRSPEEKRSHRQELLKVLTARFESPIRAWGSVLDPKGKGKLSKEEFFVGCSAAGFMGDKTGLWEELKLKPNHSVRLRDLAPEVMEECAEFKNLSGKQLGRIIGAIEAAGPPDASKVGAEVDEVAFKMLCKEIGYKGPVQPLMLHFDAAGKGTVNTKSLQMFSAEKKDEKAVIGIVRKHQELKQALWREKLASVRVAPAQELLARQESLLKVGRTRRAERTGPELARREVLWVLGKRFGSIAKAWRRALNPNDLPEITSVQFLEGLKRGGVCGPKPTGEELDKYHRLYTYLISADPKATGLRLVHLDPRVEESIQELKARCAERFGTVWQAFEAFDPEATGMISTKDFRRLCHEAKVTDGVHRLIHFLDPDSEHEIALEDIDKEAWEDARDACDERRAEEQSKKERDIELGRAHMTTEPPPVGSSVGVEAKKEERRREAMEKVLQDLKQKLAKKHGNMVRAWRAAVCPDAKEDSPSGGTIDFDRFVEVCTEAGVTGAPEDAWQALGLKVPEKGKKRKSRTGKRAPEDVESRLSLLRLEPSIAQDLHELRARVKERYGSFAAAFDAVDTNATFQLDLQGFLAFCFECQFRRNERRLFEYLSRDGKLQLATLDRRAVQQVREKRLAQGGPKAAAILALEAAAQAAAAAAAKAAEEAEEEDEADGAGAADGGTPRQPAPPAAAAPPASPPPRELTAAQLQLRQEILKGFREHLVRRFGSTVKAWRALDPEGRVVLSKREFLKTLAATGYAGSPGNLWTALVGDEAEVPQGQAKFKAVSLKQVDPEGFQQLVAFYKACVSRFKSFARAFVDAPVSPRTPPKKEKKGASASASIATAEGASPSMPIVQGSQADPLAQPEPTRSYQYRDFAKLCKTVNCPKPWESIFQQVAVNDAVCWNDVRWMEEQWNMQDERPRRQKPRSVPDLFSDLPPRTSGQGPQFTSMRPRKVAMSKSTSLPALLSPVRANWNDRHHVLDHGGNKSEQLLHYMCHVQCQETVRMQRRVAQKLREVSTAQWCLEHMPEDADDWDDEY